MLLADDTIGMDRHDAFERYEAPRPGAPLRVARAMTAYECDAQDLVHDTLLRAFSSMHRFDGAYLRAWLLTIMRRLHRARRRIRAGLLIGGLGPSGGTP